MIHPDGTIDEDLERVAIAIWEKRPDCQGKPWPPGITRKSRRTYLDPANRVAAADLCLIYAQAALDAIFDREV
jgi:hypothetical protein